MAATYSTFNKTLVEFLEALSNTFDDSPDILKARDALNVIVGANEEVELPLEQFHDLFSPHFDLVLSSDDKLFSKVKLPFVDGFDMEKAYEESDEETRNAIFSYVQQLTTISVMLKTMTPDMLTSIGEIAESCVAQIRDGTLSEADAKNPLTIMSEIAKNPALLDAINKEKSL